MKKRTILLATSIAMSMLTGSSNSYADYGIAHVKKGSNTNGPDFQYWLDSSVASYGYTDIVKNAETNWNAVSGSTAKLWEISDAYASLAQIKIYVVYGSLGSGVYGAADYYNRLSNGALSTVYISDINNGSNYNFARIQLDAGSMSQWSWAERSMNTGHEIGHALGISHFEIAPAHSGSHWMKSGKFNLSSPTSEDANHLANKW
ncbi:hypothetical protein [Paenibacillus lutrae]|uniref:Peptidase M10 metallopeptidase domain-containing protein n=1 Tax=Paenibacillus lutrae TaxID=2078573 RepID=A0A7X3FJ34_9BACL|nr:hypothetical protein [Paenibacillus lutrae]MVP00558.1 hypothetical protein [Paenibacillus lutrae]